MDNVLTSEEIFNILTDNGKNIADYKDKHFHKKPSDDFILICGTIKQQQIIIPGIKK